MSPYVIRAAGADDARAVARVRIAGWRSAYPGLVHQEVLDGLDEEADTLRTLGYLSDASNPSRTVVSVDASGGVAGFLVAGPDREADDPAVGEVMALYVDPARLREGHGRVLMTAALADLHDRGCAEVRLWVLEGNTVGRAFYAACGWAPDGARQPLETLPAPDGRPVVEVRYRRLLTGPGAAPDA